MCFLFLFSFGVVRIVVPSKEFFNEYDEKQRQRYAKAEHDFDVLLANGNHCPDLRAECFNLVKDKAAKHGFLVETPMDYHSPDELALSSKVFADSIRSNSIHVFTDSLHSYGTLFCVCACADDTDMDFLGQYLDITYLSETWVSPYGIAWLDGSVGIGMIKPNTPLFRDSSCVPINADDLKCACFGRYLSLNRVDCTFMLELPYDERCAIYIKRKQRWINGIKRKRL